MRAIEKARFAAGQGIIQYNTENIPVPAGCFLWICHYQPTEALLILLPGKPWQGAQRLTLKLGYHHVYAYYLPKTS